MIKIINRAINAIKKINRSTALLFFYVEYGSRLMSTAKLVTLNDLLSEIQGNVSVDRGAKSITCLYTVAHVT